jgi:septum formation protein
MPPPVAAEPFPLAEENAVDYAVRAARAKAAALCAVSGVIPSSPPKPVVIAADTVVVLDNVILGKPRDAMHALAMLRSLAGRTHQVITGCALAMPSSAFLSFFVQSSVTFWKCPDDALAAYAACGEPLDKAGGYAVQGKGAFLVERVEGSWSNVVGLPLSEVFRLLLALEAIEIVA